MDVRATFESNPEPTEAMKPSDGALNHPAHFAQSAAVWRAALGHEGLDPEAWKFFAVRLRVVATISVDGVGAATWMALLLSHQRDSFNQRQDLRGVVAAGLCQQCCQKQAVAVDDQVVLAAQFNSVSGVGASVAPPAKARIYEESRITRSQSIKSAPLRWLSMTRWIMSQTPATCQSRRRFQQVMPLHHISGGRFSHGLPVFKTKRIPLKHTRLSMGFRPGNRKRRSFGAGSSGLMKSQSSSVRSTRAMWSPSLDFHM